MAFTKSRVRIAFDVASRDGSVDVITGKAPQIWDGNDVQFELAGLYDRELIDASAVTSLLLEIKPYPLITATALFSATVSGAGTTITLDQWQAGTHQQFVVPMTAAQNAIDLQGALSRQCWLVVRATCGSTQFTLGATLITIVEDGH